MIAVPVISTFGCLWSAEYMDFVNNTTLQRGLRSISLFSKIYLCRNMRCRFGHEISVGYSIYTPGELADNFCIKRTSVAYRTDR